MQAYIAKRLILTVPILVLVAIITFTLIRLVPGDVLMSQIGQGGNYSPDKLAAMKDKMGLNDPVFVQLGKWFGDILRADFGRSLLTDKPTLSAFTRASRVTVELGLLSIVIGLLIAIPLGILSAAKQDSAVDNLGRAVATIGVSAPDFWVGTAFIVFAGLWFHYSAPFGYISVFKHPFANMRQFLVPALILGFRQSAVTMRLTRATLLEVLRQDYVRTARAKGLDGRNVLVTHALRNALIPVVTVVGIQVGLLLEGAFVTESIFAWPGVGRLAVEGIFMRDYPVVQGVVLVVALVYMCASLLVDILYVYLDPRISYS